MYAYTDLVVKCVMSALQLATFIYYLATAKLFFFSSHSDAPTAKGDSFTVAMVALSVIAMLYRTAVVLPTDIYYLVAVAPGQDPNVPYTNQQSYYSTFAFKYRVFFFNFPLDIILLVNLVRWILL